MKDFFDQEITIGDLVIRTRVARLAVITEVTKGTCKMLEFRQNSLNWTGFCARKDNIVKVLPSQLTDAQMQMFRSLFPNQQIPQTT